MEGTQEDCDGRTQGNGDGRDTGKRYCKGRRETVLYGIQEQFSEVAEGVGCRRETVIQAMRERQNGVTQGNSGNVSVV